MDKQVAQKIHASFTHPSIMEALEAYIDDRIAKLCREIDNLQSSDDFRRLQGQVSELKRLKNIKTYAENIVNPNIKG